MMNSDPSVLALELRQFHHPSQLHKIRLIIYNRLNYKVLHRKFCNFVRIHQTISNKECRKPHSLCLCCRYSRSVSPPGRFRFSAFRESPSGAMAPMISSTTSKPEVTGISRFFCFWTSIYFCSALQLCKDHRADANRACCNFNSSVVGW